jgi:hypothetical protein
LAELHMQNMFVATAIYFFVTYGLDAYAFNGKYYGAMLAVISRIYQHVQ